MVWRVQVFMFAFKAGPGLFEQPWKSQSMKPVSQTRILLMYLIHLTLQAFWTWFSNWKYVYQQANSDGRKNNSTQWDRARDFYKSKSVHSPNWAIPTDANDGTKLVSIHSDC